MAKQIGPVKIEGTIDDLTFFKDGDAYYARRKRDAGKMSKSPSNAAFWARSHEFSSGMKAALLLKKGLRTLRTPRYSQERLSSLMLRLKKLDPISPLGQRNVTEALRTEAGRNLLTGFNFNVYSALQEYVKKPFQLGSNQDLHITDVLPGSGLLFPENAEYMILSAVRMHIDFPAGTVKTILYGEEAVFRSGKTQSILLRPLEQDTACGYVLYFLQIRFFKKSKYGKRWPLDSRKKDVLCLFSIDPEPGEINLRALSDEEILDRQEDWTRRPKRSNENCLRDIVSGRTFTKEEYEDFWE